MSDLIARPRAWLVEDPDPNGPRTFIVTQDREDAYSLGTDEAPPIPLYDAATIERLTAERDAFKATLFDEMDENLRLRALGGALPDENITAFTERIIAERDRLTAEVAALREDATDRLNGLDTTKRIRFYEHDYYPLSNFSSFTLIWRGIRFDTSEAAYHFEKFNDCQDGALADTRAIQYSIRVAPSAHEAFKIAERNRAHRRPDWDDVKVGIMRDILRAKVNQHEYVRRKLLATGDRELVEDSWRDDFWGWGPQRDGKNMLGRLWMEVRAELQRHAARKGGS